MNTYQKIQARILEIEGKTLEDELKEDKHNCRIKPNTIVSMKDGKVVEGKENILGLPILHQK